MVMRDARHRLGLVRHQPHMNGNIAAFRKEAEGQSKVIRPTVDHSSLVDDDILAAMGFQELRQKPLKCCELAPAIVPNRRPPINGRRRKDGRFGRTHDHT